MKRRISLIVIACVAAVSLAYSQDRSFSLNGGLTFDNYGRLDNGKSISTEYVGFRITPDWRFAKHWGIKLGLGSEWAFYSNVGGKWDRPMYDMCNLNAALAPYYEFKIDNWFVDLGAVAGFRVRLAYMNTALVRQMTGMSVGVGLDFRFGYHINNRWSVFADCNAMYSVYDIVRQNVFTDDKAMTGCINATVGVSCNLYSY